MKMTTVCIVCGLEIALMFGRCQTCWRRKATEEMKRAFNAGQASITSHGLDEAYKRVKVSWGDAKHDDQEMYFTPDCRPEMTERQAIALLEAMEQHTRQLQRMMAILEEAVAMATPGVNRTPTGGEDPAFFDRKLDFMCRAARQADGDRYTLGFPAPAKPTWSMVLQWWMFN